ncbi:hypothetical protein [Cytobacillus sp. IB215665]|uniref:hypothetical protein n=1 Tax=Cytobacillus sp. IB215665 TaxID=3097357 RepID=UPI002A104C64|nr:hypothetical protein [Cytobacillus sp. IB215665]MDX8368054.1 hypothetical protein [Cytobacillus sp. IB215665]
MEKHKNNTGTKNQYNYFEEASEEISQQITEAYSSGVIEQQYDKQQEAEDINNK